MSHCEGPDPCSKAAAAAEGRGEGSRPWPSAQQQGHLQAPCASAVNEDQLHSWLI